MMLSLILRLRRNKDDDDGLTCAVDSRSDHASMGGGMNVVNVSRHTTNSGLRHYFTTRSLILSDSPLKFGALDVNTEILLSSHRE